MNDHKWIDQFDSIHNKIGRFDKDFIDSMKRHNRFHIEDKNDDNYTPGYRFFFDWQFT